MAKPKRFKFSLLISSRGRLRLVCLSVVELSILLRNNMSTAVAKLVNTFDSLTERQKQEAAGVILRRVLDDEPDEIPDEAFAALASELFADLDAEEARHARR